MRKPARHKYAEAAGSGMGIFSRHLGMAGLPENLRELLGVLDEMDRILSVEEKLILGEKRLLAAHRKLLEEYDAHGRGGKATRLLLDLTGRLQRLHAELLGISADLRRFEKSLRATSVARWDAAPLIQFLDGLPSRLSFEGRELFSEGRLLLAVEKGGGELLPEDTAEFSALVRSLEERSAHLLRLQRLLLDTAGMLR